MIEDKMISAFQKAEGGLFSDVEKADVGDAVAKLQERGVALMSWADPFYPLPSVPPHVAEAMIASIESGFASHYTAPIGNSELKEVIAEKLEKFNGLKVEPQRNILITPGSDSGLFFSMLPFIKPNDEVMIIDPSYPNNFQNTEIMGGKVVPIPVFKEDAYQFRIEEFKKRLTAQTKMIVLTNPNNPTTTVYRRKQMEQLAEFAVENDLIVVVDQAFEQPCFDHLEMVTMASLPGMWERTISVFSLSKGMGLSGLRVGYIVADAKIMDKMYGTAVTVLGATNTAAQMGAIAALQNDQFMEPYFASFDRRRKLVYELLHDIPGVSLLLSESGFLSWVDVSKLGTGAEVMAYLSEHALVAVNSGDPYGAAGANYIRIVHGVLNEEQLREAMLRIRESLWQLAQAKGLA